MTTAELPPAPPLAQEDPLLAFRSALDSDDPAANRLVVELARQYREGIAEMDMGANEEKPADQKHLAYWRYCVNPKCPNEGHRTRTGWIVTGPARKSPFGDIQAEEFKKVYHAESLEEKYGAYKLNHYEVNGLRHSGTYDPSHPQGVLETLCGLPGGILEIPLLQFLTLRMHHTPMLLSMRPDAKAWIDKRLAANPALNEYGEVECDLGCAGRSFLTQADYESHQEAVHREHKASVAAAREMGKEISASMSTLSEALAKGQPVDGSNAPLMEAIASILKNQNDILAVIAQQNAPASAPVATAKRPGPKE